MEDPFDTRRSYIAVPSPVEPDKPQNSEDIQPEGSEYNFEDIKETSLLKNN